MIEAEHCAWLAEFVANAYADGVKKARAEICLPQYYPVTYGPASTTAHADLCLNMSRFARVSLTKKNVRSTIESKFARERLGKMPSTFQDAMINYYVKDVEGLAAFYCENFGFTETFRTPTCGPAVHIEVRLGNFLLGLADIEAARSMHNLTLNPGLPRGEVAMWTADVDEVYATLTQKGIRCISPPHNFLETPPLRAAWFEDPEGNLFQIVCKQK